MAKCVWTLQGEEILEFISQADHSDARGLLHEAVAALRHEDLVRLIVTMWSVWYARRQAIHENIFQSPLLTYNYVERFIADLEPAIPNVQKKIGVPAQTPRWILPPEGVMKINVDAALSKIFLHIVTVAVIARDEAGTFLGASAIVMEGVSDLETVETLACREGLALVSDLMLRKVRIANDCATIVKNMRGLGMSPYGHIIREIKAGMASFALVEVVYESRNSKGDAHRLAKSSIYEYVGGHVWLLFPPNRVPITI